MSKGKIKFTYNGAVRWVNTWPALGSYLAESRAGEFDKADLPKITRDIRRTWNQAAGDSVVFVDTEVSRIKVKYYPSDLGGQTRWATGYKEGLFSSTEESDARVFDASELLSIEAAVTRNWGASTPIDVIQLPDTVNHVDAEASKIYIRFDIGNVFYMRDYLPQNAKPLGHEEHGPIKEFDASEFESVKANIRKRYDGATVESVPVWQPTPKADTSVDDAIDKKVSEAVAKAVSEISSQLNTTLRSARESAQRALTEAQNAQTFRNQAATHATNAKGYVQDAKSRQLEAGAYSKAAAREADKATDAAVKSFRNQAEAAGYMDAARDFAEQAGQAKVDKPVSEPQFVIYAVGPLGGDRLWYNDDDVYIYRDRKKATKFTVAELGKAISFANKHWGYNFIVELAGE